jgi:hypothetical protein
MPIFSTTGKGVLAFTIAHYAKYMTRGWRESRAGPSPPPADPFCGYSLQEVDAIYKSCERASPKFGADALALDREGRTRVVTGMLSCSQSEFQQAFGFRRPPPGG